MDSNLNFDSYVSSLCKKAGKKLSVLARLSNFMSLNQRRTLLKTFIESQFGYCPLIWMFHGIIVNKKLTTSTKGSYVLFIKITLVLLNTYLKGINMSLFTIGTFSHWL